MILNEGLLCDGKKDCSNGWDEVCVTETMEIITQVGFLIERYKVFFYLFLLIFIAQMKTTCSANKEFPSIANCLKT